MFFGLRVLRLKCEYSAEPLCVDIRKPRLSWIIEGSRRGIKQSAYQILVSSSEEFIANDRGDLWDSGKVVSDQSIYVVYGGKDLISSQKVFWKVRIWDDKGNISSWSKISSWTMGVLNEAEWRASWIGAPNGRVLETMLLRKKFTVRSGLVRALIHVCGLGQYEVTFNGKPVTEDLFSPGWTKYDKTCLYDTYEITDKLTEGNNVIGLFLGNGMYNVHGGRYTKFIGSFGPIKAIAQIKLEYEDNTIDYVVTDNMWQIHSGPITFSCIYGGEDYDARLEQKDWNKPGFEARDWEYASVLGGPGGKLRGYSFAAPPIRALGKLKAKRINIISSTISIYDFGQNVSIMPRLVVSGTEGCAVKITPAELLHENGRVDRGSVTEGSESPAYWSYTLGNSQPETYFSKFFYHGARYLEAELIANKQGELPKIESLESIIVHSNFEPTGYFSCSSELFNRIRELIRWAQRSNLMHVITDCPHRERLSWLEQYHLNGPSLRYEFDLRQMFAKSMNDMADSQLENGLVPDIAPEYTIFSEGFRDSPEWGSAYVIVPWQQYEWTGDKELLRNHYDGMKKYVVYLKGRSKNNIISHGLGDWYDIGPNSPGKAQLTPKELTATAFYYQDLVILSDTALLLGYSEEAKYFRNVAIKVRRSFNREFFDANKGLYSTGSQCANAIPLVMGLVPKKYRPKVLNHLVEDIRNRGNALTAGDIGYRYLLRALSDGERSDVIFDMNSQSDKPGYGYQLKKGATSLTEAWDANPHSSNNHFMLGYIIEWFYRDLAGLAYDPDVPGFKKIIIKPNIIEGITWAAASYESIFGPILSAWYITNGILHMHINIPLNTSAKVFVPSLPEKVTEDNEVPDEKSHIRYLGYMDDHSIYEIGSGSYHFEAKLV